jgi:nucleoid-associated protein YgaU
MRAGEEARSEMMRTAVLTTACVIAALIVWSSVREAERAQVATFQAAAAAGLAPALPDVAAAPAPRTPSAREAADASDAEATYRPATSEAARQHVVAAGETLADIAARYYGDAARAADLYAANRDRIRDPAQLHPGQTLIIP